MPLNIQNKNAVSKVWKGPTNFSLLSGDGHESLAETNDKLKFVGLSA